MFSEDEQQKPCDIHFQRNSCFYRSNLFFPFNLRVHTYIQSLLVSTQNSSILEQNEGRQRVVKEQEGQSQRRVTVIRITRPCNNNPCISDHETPLILTVATYVIVSFFLSSLWSCVCSLVITLPSIQHFLSVTK